MLTTCSTLAEAEKIARAIIERRLAACVNIFPVRSIFRWKGSIEESDEQLLVIKTRSTLFKKASECVKGLHSYEVPEIISTEIKQGSRPYLKWLEDSVGKS
jgi:periplasmic divalent cation tolerance protein